MSLRSIAIGSPYCDAFDGHLQDTERVLHSQQYAVREYVSNQNGRLSSEEQIWKTPSTAVP